LAHMRFKNLVALKRLVAKNKEAKPTKTRHPKQPTPRVARGEELGEFAGENRESVVVSN